MNPLALRWREHVSLSLKNSFWFEWRDPSINEHNLLKQFNHQYISLLHSLSSFLIWVSFNISRCFRICKHIVNRWNALFMRNVFLNILNLSCRICSIIFNLRILKDTCIEVWAEFLCIQIKTSLISN